MRAYKPWVPKAGLKAPTNPLGARAGAWQLWTLGVVLLVTVFLLGLAWTLWHRVAGNAGPVTPVSQRPAAPDFAIVTVDGDRVALSDLRGKRVALYFMAAWCANASQRRGPGLKFGPRSEIGLKSSCDISGRCGRSLGLEPV
ncbi:MAG: hypothetical protein DIU71_19245 [Proteobacteria bacterium]|nr:MAG: hypothetical protein DIU71_19245 [Pseudomonadota bacterium]